MALKGRWAPRLRSGGARPTLPFTLRTSYEIAHVASSSHLRCKWSSRVRV